MNGPAVPVWPTEGHHHAVPTPGSRNRVILDYSPARLCPGLAVPGLSLLLGVVLWVMPRANRNRSARGDTV
jgi:hypothetical protein